ncbi:class I SAM-dependent DNA methyltransferase [Actinosynnema sp. CS-041913]|uniref:class I SAM-dependent DNA methyltransferase n=1 Tax=Actinosynnema sp. CS-041913 TaxID=3239917 RepID=UPI003D89E88E
MPDSYESEELAALYDTINAWGPSDDFYLDLVMSASSVLDVGCGTGLLLKAARDAGHPGRLCGLDPADGMLAQARARADIEWVRGDLGTTSWDHEFDLVVMTGHAFQVLLTDDEVRATFTAIRRALEPTGRFAFETRNPALRPWERWTPENATEITDPNGARVTVAHEVESVVDGVVRLSETFSGPRWPEPQVSRGSLRFLDAGEVDGLLADSGLSVHARFGDWDRGGFGDDSREIITIARPGPLPASR